MRVGWARRARWFLWLLSASLLWVACQPYLDHEEQGFVDGFEVVDLGPKRQLELTDLRVERQSVLFVFNQPLRRPASQQAKPPFTITFQPPLAVRSTEFEGVAGVRVSFVAPLPPSSSFTARIPEGWRVPSGATLWYPLKRSWTTARPELRQVITQSGFEVALLASVTKTAFRPGSSLTLIFNQPVALSTVRSALRWERVEGSSGTSIPVPFLLTELPSPEGQVAHQRFLLRANSGGDDTPHRLVLGPRVRALNGPLRGVATQRLLFEPEHALRYQGPAVLTDLGRPLTLQFSAPVLATEVARCLLSVPETAQAQVSQPPGQPSTSVSLSFAGPLPNRVTLLSGLSSVEGRILPSDLEIPILSSPEKSLKPLPLTPIALSLGQRALVGGQGPTTTWKLDLKQAISASQTSQSAWFSASPLSWERAKPTFQANAKLTKKFSGILGKGGGEPAFLAVRREPTKTKRERALVAQTDLGLQLFPGTGGVLARVTSVTTGLPLRDCMLDLYDGSGNRLRRSDRDAVFTDPDGQGKLSWTPSLESMGVAFVVARIGKDTTFAPFNPEVCRPEPELPVGFLHCERPFYAPGDSVAFSGFTWYRQIPPAPVKAAIKVVSEDGQTHLATSIEVDSDGFFLARFKAPDVVGLYRLMVTLPNGATPLVSDFRVCPVAKLDESYSLVVEPEAERATIGLRRGGLQNRQVGVRAYLRPAKRDAARLGGWTALGDRVPYWYPLSLRSGTEDHYTVEIERAGGWSRGATLVAEAFDLEDPRLVVCREERAVPPTMPHLELQVDTNDTDQPRQSVRFEFATEDADFSTSSIDVKARLMYRDQEQDDAWEELDSRAFRIDGGKDAWPLRFPHNGVYQLRVELKTDGEATREAVWERSVSSSDSTLLLEPSALARTGEPLLIQALGWADRSKQLFAVELGGSQGGWPSLMSPTAEGRFGPLLVPSARASFLRVLLTSGSYPSWGHQSLGRQRWAKDVSLDSSSSRGTVSLEVGRRDGAREKVRGDDDLIVRLKADSDSSGWRGTLGWRRVIPGWEATVPDLLSSYLGRIPWSSPSPAGFPLLTAEQVENTAIWGGVNVDPEAELKVPAPKLAGSYLWTFVGRDAAGRFALDETPLEVGDFSGWEVFSPWGVRPGDIFAAGLRFISGSGESGSIGLVATAIGQGSLLPATYLRTDGLVKKGKERLLSFEYRAPQEASLGFHGFLPLQWELGYQGKRASQRAQIPIWSPPPVAKGTGRKLLSPTDTARTRVNGPQRWRVVLETPQLGSADTLVSLTGPQGSLGKVLLRAGQPAVSLEGPAPGTVQVRHLRGGPISWQMFRLEPDLGQTPLWGAGVYLFRGLLDAQGERATTMVSGQSARIVLDLVNPANLPRATLRLPLPGGTTPLSLEPVDGAGARVPWRIEPGVMVLELEDLKPGEYRWLVNVRTLTSGDFLWPTARVTTPDGQLQALSGSSRVKILDR